jgi:hypothetical protein
VQLGNLLSVAFPKVASNAWWSIPGGSSQTVEINLGASSSILSSRAQVPSPRERIHKHAYGKNFSVIERVYVRTRKGLKGATISPTSHIRAKKTSNKSFREKLLGKALQSTPETTDGLRRSPRISKLLDGHRAINLPPLLALQRLHPSSPDPLCKVHRRVRLTTFFLVLLNFLLYQTWRNCLPLTLLSQQWPCRRRLPNAEFPLRRPLCNCSKAKQLSRDRKGAVDRIWKTVFLMLSSSNRISFWGVYFVVVWNWVGSWPCFMYNLNRSLNLLTMWKGVSSPIILFKLLLMTIALLLFYLGVKWTTVYWMEIMSMPLLHLYYWALWFSAFGKDAGDNICNTSWVSLNTLSWFICFSKVKLFFYVQSDRENPRGTFWSPHSKRCNNLLNLMLLLPFWQYSLTCGRLPEKNLLRSTNGYTE